MVLPESAWSGREESKPNQNPGQIPSQTRSYSKTATSREKEKYADLNDFKQKWTKISETNPNRKIGLEIVDHLISSNASQSHPVYKMESSSVGSVAMQALVYDILAEKPATREYHSIEDKITDSSSSRDVLASFLVYQTNPGTDPTTTTHLFRMERSTNSKRFAQQALCPQRNSQ
jgi:hypothetical protein